MASFEKEKIIVDRLLELIGISINNAVDPKADGTETGVDVLISYKNKKIGVQVTGYHADEDKRTKGGSRLRIEEKEKALKATENGGSGVYGAWAPANYMPSLYKRICEKIVRAKKYPYENMDEIWLLIYAQDPEYGASTSTMIATAMVDPEDLNANFHLLLEGAPFTSVFLLLYGEGVVYEWRRKHGWKLRVDKLPEDKEHIEHMKNLIFGRNKEWQDWLANPDGMSDKAIKKYFAERDNSKTVT